MRCLLNVVVVCMFTFVAHAEEESVIPKGIRYKKAPAEVNKKGEQALKRAFSLKSTDQNVLSLFENKTLICGPGLWRELKKDKVLSKLDKGKVAFQMPILDNNGNISRLEKHEGKLFQSPDEVLAFWKAFSLRTYYLTEAGAIYLSDPRNHKEDLLVTEKVEEFTRFSPLESPADLAEQAATHLQL